METKFATHRGHRIAYTVAGNTKEEVAWREQAVVLGHGFLSGKANWKEYQDAFAQTGFTAIAVDSLGHGESDKPDDPNLYGREQRAGDIVAVLDAEGIEKAHFLGYSMGGWTGAALAKFFPHRLRSLVIGGWDPGRRRETFSTFEEAVANAGDPVRGESMGGLRACWDHFCWDFAGSEEILADLVEKHGVPLLFWAGREDDSCFAGVEAMTKKHGWSFLSVEGNHVQARRGNQIALKGVVGFVGGDKGEAKL